MDAQKRIKQLMEERGWTDYRLVKESGLSHSTVTNMFNRNNAPTLPTLEAVCGAFLSAWHCAPSEAPRLPPYAVLPFHTGYNAGYISSHILPDP